MQQQKPYIFSWYAAFPFQQAALLVFMERIFFIAQDRLQTIIESNSHVVAFGIDSSDYDHGCLGVDGQNEAAAR